LFGVKLGVGMENWTSERIEEPFAEFDRWRACPNDIVGGSRCCCQLSAGRVEVYSSPSRLYKD
jgi:hypothetical protein